MKSQNSTVDILYKAPCISRDLPPLSYHYIDLEDPFTDVNKNDTFNQIITLDFEEVDMPKT